MALFRGGIPTGMDVDKLMKEIEVQPGTVVPYAEVERIMGVHLKATRFRSVTQAWRKRIFREKLLDSTAEGGEFYFLTADAAHDKGRRIIKQIGRATGRLTVRVDAIDANELTGPRREIHNLLRRESQAMLDAARKSAKAIAGPRPVQGANLKVAK